MHGNISKRHMQIMNLKNLDQYGTKNLNWLMNHVLARMCQTNLGISNKHEDEDNLPIQSYIIRIQIYN